jgi:hypothetical protein
MSSARNHDRRSGKTLAWLVKFATTLECSGTFQELLSPSSGGSAYAENMGMGRQFFILPFIGIEANDLLWTGGSRMIRR